MSDADVLLQGHHGQIDNDSNGKLMADRPGCPYIQRQRETSGTGTIYTSDRFE